MRSQRSTARLSLRQLWSGSIARAMNPARGFTSQSPTTPSMPLQAGTTIAFGLRATSGTGAALAASGAGCELNVRTDDIAGAGTPCRTRGALARIASGRARRLRPQAHEPGA
jgi:hypothetical protein